ncbi:hypothetical protein U1Q18_003450 [Sarracenia purpurea var. burkii]
MMSDGGEEYSHSAAAAANGEFVTSLQNSASWKKRRSKNKRRFSDEQIRLLETMFESESKLEPRKKLELAKEVGLQPRQVAIWFQNKRARWKSKQLERDYGILRANYSNLASQFETLKKEKQALVIQLQELNGLMENSREGNQGYRQAATGKAEYSNGGQLDRDDEVKAEFGEKPSSSVAISEHEILSENDEDDDDDSSIKAEYFGLDEEPELRKMVEPADSSLTSPENWDRLDSNALLDQSSSSYPWWDFWS